MPKTIIKDVREILEISKKEDTDQKSIKKMSRAEREDTIRKLTSQMRQAAQLLEFEQAAFLRDKIEKLRQSLEDRAPKLPRGKKQ